MFSATILLCLGTLATMALPGILLVALDALDILASRRAVSRRMARARRVHADRMARLGARR